MFSFALEFYFSPPNTVSHFHTPFESFFNLSHVHISQHFHLSELRNKMTFKKNSIFCSNKKRQMNIHKKLCKSQIWRINIQLRWIIKDHIIVFSVKQVKNLIDIKYNFSVKTSLFNVIVNIIKFNIAWVNLWLRIMIFL